jgi:DNA adenine methylase
MCGGAALLFLREEPAKTEVINDIHGELVNLYRVVQNHLVEFVNQFRLAITSRQIFEWHKITPPETLTDIQRAARFYYLQQNSFGGKMVKPTFGTATTSPAFNLCRIEESLSAASMRLGGVFVEKLPWQACLKKYDRPHTFFYADPPYFETEGYGVEFGLEQYEEMAALMGSCAGKVMVSINDHPKMREVFARFNLKSLDIKYSVGNNHGPAQSSKELIFTNW